VTRLTTKCCAVSFHLAFCWIAFTSAPSTGAQSAELAGTDEAPAALQKANEGFTQKGSARSMRVDVNLVLVPVTVADVMNRPVMNLQKENFALFQDSEPQKIDYFSTEDAPVSVGLLLDLSKSMTDKFEAERAAVTEFFRNANKADDYFVITFADHPKLVTTSTQSLDTIQSNLAVQTPDGNTALFDAIAEAAERMHAAQYRRKALLIISDGGDNHSRHNLRGIKKLMQESDVEVYAIGIFDTGPFKTLEEALGKRWLSQITDATGGRTITVESQERAPEAAATISREMRSLYVLGYHPTAAQASVRRKIKVEVAAAVEKTVLHAYYKTGYLPTASSSHPHADNN
jgi:Ca-activated chloride channel family protein